MLGAALFFSIAIADAPITADALRGRLPGNTLNTGPACWEGPPGTALPPPGLTAMVPHPSGT